MILTNRGDLGLFCVNREFRMGLGWRLGERERERGGPTFLWVNQMGPHDLSYGSYFSKGKGHLQTLLYFRFGDFFPSFLIDPLIDFCLYK